MPSLVLVIYTILETVETSVLNDCNGMLEQISRIQQGPGEMQLGGYVTTNVCRYNASQQAVFIVF